MAFTSARASWILVPTPPIGIPISIAAVSRHPQGVSWRPQENTQKNSSEFIHGARPSQALDLAPLNYPIYHSTEAIREPGLPLPPFPQSVDLIPTVISPFVMFLSSISPIAR